MFDFFPLTENLGVVAEQDAIDMIRSDHDSVKELFHQYEKSENRQSKRKIAKQALGELKVHAVLEEEIFYPTVRRGVGQDIMNEADEEHHVAKVLIAELEEMDGRGDHYDAKFAVLAENVRHHIKEEESEMLPKAKSLDIDFAKLGQEMLRRKRQLLADGVPPAGEEAMVGAAHGSGDSPAKAARKRSTAARKRSRT
jgi:hypothetical protein